MLAARQRALGHLAMLAFSAFIAGSFSLGVRVANDISPVALTVARFWLAVVLVGAVLTAIGQAPRRWPVAAWRFLVLGALYAAYFVAMFEGLKTAPTVGAAAVFTLTPVMAAGFAWLLLRQTTTRRMVLALAIGAAGAVWVIFRGDPARLWAFDLGRGEAIYALGCIAHAFYTPLVRRLGRGEPVLQMTFLTLIGGGLVLLAYGWPVLYATDWAALPAEAWITLAYLAVFSTAASMFLLQFAALRLPSAKVMAYTYLAPSWVILWDAALGGALPPAATLGGVALTLIALGVLLRHEPQAG